jgi:hypothetical protein
LLSGYLSAPCPPREPCVRHWRGHSTTRLPSVLDSRPSCGLSISSSARTVATVRWEVYCRVDGSRRANAWRRGRRLAAGAARSPVATENGPHEVEATSPGELYGRLHLTRTKGGPFEEKVGELRKKHGLFEHYSEFAYEKLASGARRRVLPPIARPVRNAHHTAEKITPSEIGGAFKTYVQHTDGSISGLGILRK